MDYAKRLSFSLSAWAWIFSLWGGDFSFSDAVAAAAAALYELQNQCEKRKEGTNERRAKGRIKEKKIFTHWQHQPSRMDLTWWTRRRRRRRRKRRRY